MYAIDTIGGRDIATRNYIAHSRALQSIRTGKSQMSISKPIHCIKSKDQQKRRRRKLRTAGSMVEKTFKEVKNIKSKRGAVDCRIPKTFGASKLKGFRNSTI
eukprot:UN12878